MSYKGLIGLDDGFGGVAWVLVCFFQVLRVRVLLFRLYVTNLFVSGLGLKIHLRPNPKP